MITIDIKKMIFSCSCKLNLFRYLGKLCVPLAINRQNFLLFITGHYSYPIPILTSNLTYAQIINNLICHLLVFKDYKLDFYTFITNYAKFRVVVELPETY